MEAGIPMLAATDKNTDFGKMIEEIGAGLWCETGDIQKYKENLEKLMTDKVLKEKIMHNGTVFMEHNMTVSIACQIILSKVIA